MRRCCEKCGCGYNDEIHSTVCPHKGIGFCAVCDCVVCICDGSNKRSQNYKEQAE